MRPAPEVHDALARLLSYPDAESARRRAADVALARRAAPDAAPALDAFLAAASELDAGALEELYTRTFDHTATRSLEIGWQLFGESYARGVLLVRLRALLREHGIPESAELPDHLSHVLPLLGRAPAPLAAALAAIHVRPAAAKVRAALRDADSAWAGVLEAVESVVAAHAADETPAEVTR